jgi:hypothetical protein
VGTLCTCLDTNAEGDRGICKTLTNCGYSSPDKDKMRKEMEAEIRAQLALNQEAMQSWDEKVSPLTF